MPSLSLDRNTATVDRVERQTTTIGQRTDMKPKTHMKTRKLGHSGLEVSAIGLGCMGMVNTKGFYGPSDDAQSIGVIHRALELGVNFLDTADMYGLGANEELVGKALKGKRDRAIL